MGLRDYRWDHTQQGVAVRVGHFEVANMTRPQLLTAVQSAINDWTAPLNGPTFVAVDGGDIQFSHAYMDGQNTVCWDFLPDCGIGAVTCFRSADNFFKRALEMDVVLSPGGHGCPWGDYCWYDCAAAHSHPCGPDDEYDAQTILLHEFGHGIVGLNHYAPCDWTESVMFANADVGCARHRALGQTDARYARTEFDGIRSDLNEPGDDGLVGATDLGAMYVHGDQVDEEGDSACPVASTSRGCGARRQVATNSWS
jgi:hypothetical protein